MQRGLLPAQHTAVAHCHGHAHTHTYDGQGTAGEGLPTPPTADETAVRPPPPPARAGAGCRPDAESAGGGVHIPPLESACGSPEAFICAHRGGALRQAPWCRPVTGTTARRVSARAGEAAREMEVREEREEEEERGKKCERESGDGEGAGTTLAATSAAGTAAAGVGDTSGDGDQPDAIFIRCPGDADVPQRWAATALPDAGGPAGGAPVQCMQVAGFSSPRPRLNHRTCTQPQCGTEVPVVRVPYE